MPRHGASPLSSSSAPAPHSRRAPLVRAHIVSSVGPTEPEPARPTALGAAAKPSRAAAAWPLPTRGMLLAGSRSIGRLAGRRASLALYKFARSWSARAPPRNAPSRRQLLVGACYSPSVVIPDTYKYKYIHSRVWLTASRGGTEPTILDRIAWRTAARAVAEAGVCLHASADALPHQLPVEICALGQSTN
eukprot:scaffold97273_cov67-Phaeocystis_antarctica.AAC.2